MMPSKIAAMLAFFAIFTSAIATAGEPKASSELDQLKGAVEGYAVNDAGGGPVKIHYVSLGQGPVVVMVHGFPDYWYTWRNQMQALADAGYQAVAIDQRGFNLSDKPQGVDAYAMTKLTSDVDAVRKHLGADKIILVGHDWGGAVAWSYVMNFPNHVDRLIILNLPHPKGLSRELKENPQQRLNSQYARNFQQPGFEKILPASFLTGWVSDPQARAFYDAAMKRSSLESMLNYYKANYPKPPYEAEAKIEYPKVKCPVLMFHGLRDQALLPGALNGTWDWIDNELTLITLPKANHFVQQDAAALVSQRMVGWLNATKPAKPAPK